MNLDITLVDVLVVLAILVSAAYAAYRGFVNETLSIFAWAAAAFATLYFAPSLVPFFRQHMSPLVGALVAYAVVFLVVLIPLSFVSFRFSESVRNSPVGALDRVLGFAFGVVRGLAVIGIAYLLFSMIVPLKDHPRWLKEARLLPLIQSSSDVLLALVPNQDVRAVEDSQKATAESGPTPQPAPREGRKTAKSKHVRKSYGAEDRRALDRLIEATGSGNGKQ